MGWVLLVPLRGGKYVLVSIVYLLKDFHVGRSRIYLTGEPNKTREGWNGIRETNVKGTQLEAIKLHNRLVAANILNTIQCL